MALSTNYRPETFKEFIGNEIVKTALESKLKLPSNKRPHVYLFIGPSGCGKTTLARIVARYVKCSEHEFYEMNAADFRGIDTVREVIKQSKWQPMSGGCRVWLWDECHKISPDGQEAMLKLLEEPSENTYFILATTEPTKLKTTLRGRCTTFEVRPLEEDEMIGFLEEIVEEEGKKEIPEKILRRIHIDSFGSPRNALQMLERIIDLPAKDMAKALEQTQETETQTIDLCRALLKMDKWSVVAKIISGLQAEPEQIRHAVLGYCSNVLLSGKDSAQAAIIINVFKEPFYNSGKPGLVVACYDSIHE